MGRSIFNLEIRKKIEELLKGGYSVGKIAEHLGIAPSTVGLEIRKNNGYEYDAEKAQNNVGKVYSLTTLGVRHKLDEYSEEELAVLDRYMKREITTKEVQALTKRTVAAIHTKVSKMRKMKEVKPFFAKERQLELNLDLNHSKKEVPVTNDLEKRVSIIEMQIEILLDTIKGLTK